MFALISSRSGSLSAMNNDTQVSITGPLWPSYFFFFFVVVFSQKILLLVLLLYENMVTH